MKSLFFDGLAIAGCLLILIGFDDPLGLFIAAALIAAVVLRGWLRMHSAYRQHQVNLEMGQLELASQALEHFWGDHSQATPPLDLTSDECIEAKLLTIDEALARVISETASLDLVLEDLTQAAQQTRLTSMNAMFSAAQSGEEGRGFALVAEESYKIASNGLEICVRSKPVIWDIHEGAKRLSAQIAHQVQTVKKDSKRYLHQIENLAQTISVTLNSVEQQLQQAIHSDERIKGRLQTLNVTLDSTIDAANKLRTVCFKLQEG